MRSRGVQKYSAKPPFFWLRPVNSTNWYAFTGGASYESASNLTVQLYVYLLENQRPMLILFEKTLRNFVRTSLFRPAQ